jgi:hypothetical protein
MCTEGADDGDEDYVDGQESEEEEYIPEPSSKHKSGRHSKKRRRLNDDGGSEGGDSDGYDEAGRPTGTAATYKGCDYEFSLSVLADINNQITTYSCS